MADDPPGWTLEGFLERLDLWVGVESPPQDLRMAATAWILTRKDDPYRGVRRQRGFPNLWFGIVPNTHDDRGNVVVCSYWIEESRRVVRCDSFATLSWPV